jgi:hypothetical protein
LGYKNDKGIPPHLRRRFSLLAGLLEIGDREFDEIRIDIGEYVNSFVDKEISDWAGIRIDAHSLEYFCEKSELLKRAAKTIRNSIGAIKSEEYDFLPNVIALEYLGINTLEDLKDLLDVHFDTTIQVAETHLKELGEELPLSDAEVLEYLNLTACADLGHDRLSEMLRQIFPTGSESNDNAYANKIYNIFTNIKRNL